LLAALFLGFVFIRTWLNQWRQAAPGYRRRLEGGLAALLGFGVQSMVDTFTLTPLLVPVLIILSNMPLQQLIWPGRKAAFASMKKTPIVSV